LPEHSYTKVQSYFKAEGLAEDARRRNGEALTMHEQALADMAADASPSAGRWAKHHPTYVTGSGPGPNLPAPAWSHDPCGTEPPLNEDVNWLPSMETISGLPREEEPPAEEEQPNPQPWRRQF
jgi:hypothetical protein